MRTPHSCKSGIYVLRGSILLLLGFANACAAGRGPTPPTGLTSRVPNDPPVMEPEAPPHRTTTLDTIRAGTLDNGKMWTFEYPPLEYLRTTYGFMPDSAWFRNARLGALRIPRCTASFVSPQGLVMTNHHCARERIEKVSREGEDLIMDGFYAASFAEERPIHDYWADQLVQIRDVSDRVSIALEGISDPVTRRERRKEVIKETSEEVAREFGGDEAEYRVEMVELYSGGRYCIYVFRRYTDIRLVMAPEAQVANYGGEWDNFTYPRYDLDMAFYRIYGEDGKPLSSEHFFPFDAGGSSQGDLVFVIGNPGSTSRLQTVAQLEYRRDVSDRAYADLLRSRTPVLEEFALAHPEEARGLSIRNTIWENLNGLKAFSGMVEGLHDPVVLARRRDHERRLQAAVDADPALKAQFGDLIPRMAAIQRRKREFAPEFASLLALGHPTLGSGTLGRGLYAMQYLKASSLGAPDAIVEELRKGLAAYPDQPKEINEGNLAARFRDIAREFGPDHPIVEQILEGRSAEGAAATILGRSVLTDSASTVSALDAGTLTLEDPAVKLAELIARRFGPALTIEQRVSPEETEITEALGRASLAVFGTAVPPDATFSLRFSDGVIEGYEYNGTLAPPFTTFFGIYDRYSSYGPGTAWDLPPRWLEAQERLHLAVPLNFVSTADIAGGSSGSPLVNRELRLVGLAFDGNIESLPGDYIYLPERNRTVSVDVRGILEVLDHVYGASRLVQELRAPAQEAGGRGLPIPPRASGADAGASRRPGDRTEQREVTW